MLTCPHLMLSNTGRDNDVFLCKSAMNECDGPTSDNLGLNVQLPDNLLRLELFTILRRSVGEWVFLLVALDLVEPS